MHPTSTRRPTTRPPRAADSGRSGPPPWATARRVARAVVAVGLALVALNVAEAWVYTYDDSRILDLRIGYDHGDVLELFGAYGTAGRRAYALALVVDSIYPVVLLTGVVLATARAFGKRPWLWVAPAAFAILDLVENSLFGAALAGYPDVPAGLVSVAAPITTVKLVAFVPTAVTALAALIVLGYRRYAGRRSTSRSEVRP